jgi:DNA-binding CsgD family transcriptional regulator
MVAILRNRNAPFAAETYVGRLRSLLQALPRTTAPNGDHAIARVGRDRSPQILLDTDFEGDRYLLLRIPLAQPRRLSLSPCEWEIARLVAEGHPNKRIAALLNLSLWTIGTHVRRIFAKLGVSSRAAMVARLLEADEGDGPALDARPRAGRGVDDDRALAAPPVRSPAQPEAVATMTALPGSRSRAGDIRLASAAPARQEQRASRGACGSVTCGNTAEPGTGRQGQVGNARTTEDCHVLSY